MVQRLEVRLLILLPPDLVEALLGLPPLLLLGLQPVGRAGSAQGRPSTPVFHHRPTDPFHARDSPLQAWGLDSVLDEGGSGSGCGDLTMAGLTVTQTSLS